MKAQLIFILALLLSAVSCSNDNSKVLQRLNEAPATVREIQGANNLFVIELANNTNGLYSEYIVPSSALSAEYKEDGLSVLISGDVTNNYAAIDGYVSEGKGNTVTLNGLYNTVEVTTMSKSVTGTVIGSYYNGSASLLVQIDKKYPIGKTFEYIQHPCLSLPEYGTYKNMIEVQPRLPLYDFPENETVMNKRISFSYREYRYGEEDFALFDTGKPGNAMCAHPDVPRYIITDCQVIK